MQAKTSPTIWVPAANAWKFVGCLFVEFVCGGRNPCVVPPPNCVVWLRWFPTLPHPVGCSTIGVHGLSFQVRNGAGRFPMAMTTAKDFGINTCSDRALVFWVPLALRVDRPLHSHTFTRAFVDACWCVLCVFGVGGGLHSSCEHDLICCVFVLLCVF